MFGRTISLRRWFIGKLMGLLPPTCCFALKRFSLRFAEIVVGAGTNITSTVQFLGLGPITIGENVFIGHGTLVIAANAPIRIGNGVDIAPRVLIVNGTHNISNIASRRAGGGKSLPITIGEGTWIGAGSTIIAGVSVGAGTVIGAGSVVVDDVPSCVLAAGNPCRVIHDI